MQEFTLDSLYREIEKIEQCEKEIHPSENEFVLLKAPLPSFLIHKYEDLLNEKI